MSDSNSSRIISIDVFRGCVILIMVFVNDVASIKALPWWTYHIPYGTDGMTYVDIVYPAFLFIVGMAIPLAFQNRKESFNDLTVWKHIFIRTFSLAFLGALIMNGRQLNAEESGISYALWNVLMFVGVILFWNNYPKSNEKTNLYKGLQCLGLLLIIILLAIYKRGETEDLKWINWRNWSILGGIGWAYLSGCIVYYFLGKKWFLLLGSFVLLVFLNVATSLGWVDFLSGIHPIFWPFGKGATSSIVLAGVITTSILQKNAIERSKIYVGIILFAAALGLAGWQLLPFGLAKIEATPSWCLWSSAISIISFLIIYYIVDILKLRNWTLFMKSAGSNSLLTYLLPDIFYAIFGLYWLADISGSGILGAIRSTLFALFILGISTVLTKLKIRLQL
jgi:predicted acyltransferase